MPKYITKEGVTLEAFAKQYPHLVRTKIVLDSRKITSAIRDGWNIPEVSETAGEDQEDDDGVATLGKLTQEQTGVAPSSGAPKAPDAPLVSKAEQEAVRELMVPTLHASVIPEKYDEKDRLPGEETREFFTRMRKKREYQEAEKKSLVQSAAATKAAG